MEASHEGTSISFHSSVNIDELTLPEDSDTENNDLKDNEDNYHQLFGATQWRIQRVLDAGIPVWAPKLCAQIIEKCLK